MTDKELKKKIVEVVNQWHMFQNRDMNGHTIWLTNDSEKLADALIDAGIGDVNKFADTLASKIPCHSYYYGDSIVCAIYALKHGMEIKDVKHVNISEFLVDELRRKLKEAEHRAEVAEFKIKIRDIALLDRAEIIDRGTYDETPEEYVKYHLQKAEKELQEERKDD